MTCDLANDELRSLHFSGDQDQLLVKISNLSLGIYPFEFDPRTIIDLGCQLSLRTWMVFESPKYLITIQIWTTILILGTDYVEPEPTLGIQQKPMFRLA